MANSVFTLLSSVGSIVLGGMAIRSSYLEWGKLQEDPQTTTLDKVWTVLNGDVS